MQPVPTALGSRIYIADFLLDAEAWAWYLCRPGVPVAASEVLPCRIPSHSAHAAISTHLLLQAISAAFSVSNNARGQ